MSAPPTRRLLHGLVAFLSWGVAVYAVVAYTALDFGALVHPEMKAVFEARPLGIGLHVFASALALAVGPLQFSARLRERRPAWHRALGRVYLAGVALGGLAGLYMAVFAFGGSVSHTGFGALALLWLATSATALAAIRGGHVARHRRFMLRSFALAFAAVTLRLQLGASGLAGLAFEEAYPVIAWTCWVPNLLVAEWLIRARGLGSTSARQGPPRAGPRDISLSSG